MGARVSIDDNNNRIPQQPVPEYLTSGSVSCSDWSVESIVELHSEIQRLAFKNDWFGWHYDIAKLSKAMKLNKDSPKTQNLLQIFEFGDEASKAALCYRPKINIMVLVSTLIILGNASLDQKIELFFKTFYTSFDNGLTQKQLQTMLVIASKAASIIDNVKPHYQLYTNIAEWYYRKFVRDYKDYCKKNNRDKAVLFNINSKFDILTITEWIKSQGDIVELLLAHHTTDAKTVRKTLTINPTVVNSIPTTVLQSEHLSCFNCDNISEADEQSEEYQQNELGDDETNNIATKPVSKQSPNENESGLENQLSTATQQDVLEDAVVQQDTDSKQIQQLDTGVGDSKPATPGTVNYRKSILSTRVSQGNVKIDDNRKVTIETFNPTLGTNEIATTDIDNENETFMMIDISTLRETVPAIDTLKSLEDDTSSVLLFNNENVPKRYGGINNSNGLVFEPNALSSSKSVPCLNSFSSKIETNNPKKSLKNSKSVNGNVNLMNNFIMPAMLHPANIKLLQMGSQSLKFFENNNSFSQGMGDKDYRRPWRESTDLRRKKDLVATKRVGLNTIMQLSGQWLKEFIDESREIQKCHRISPLFRNMQIKQLKLNFDLLDTDNSNDLTISELSNGFPTIKATIERIFQGCDASVNHSVSFREFLSILFKSATQEENDQMDWVLNGPCTITDLSIMHLSELYNAIDGIIEPNICDSVPFSDLAATMIRCDELYPFVARWNRFERSRMTQMLSFEQTLHQLFPHYSSKTLKEYSSFVHRPRIVQLTKEQESDIKKLFMYVDLDNSGTVSYQELRRLMDQHDLNMSEGIVHSIFRYMSQDPQTDIGFDEFRSFFQYAWTFCEEPLTAFLSNVKTDPLYYTS